MLASQNTTHTQAVRCSSPPSPSLWSLIAPFDSTKAQLPFCRLHLWPLLADLDAIRASTVNRATLRFFSCVPLINSFPLLSTFFRHDSSDQSHLTPLPVSNVLCWPAVTRLHCGSWEALLPLLPRLPHLRELSICDEIWDCIDGVLPRSLRSLDVTYRWRSPPNPLTFPAGLTELTLSSWVGRCSQPMVPGSLPLSLRSLKYDVAADIACGVLPPSLTFLMLGERHHHVMGLQPGCLPAGLVELHWYSIVDARLVPGLLPAGLRELQLQDVEFNAPLDGVFPPDSQLQTLVIGSYRFTQPFDAYTLPRSLTELDLSGALLWNHSLDGVLPPSLRVLRLGNEFFQPLTAATFLTCPLLTILDLSRVHREHRPFPVGALPPSLTELHYPESKSQPPLIGSLPLSLRRLHIHTLAVLQLAALPQNLELLDLKRSRLPRFNGGFPPSLLDLRIHLLDLQQMSHHDFAAHVRVQTLVVSSVCCTGTLNPHSLPNTLTELDLNNTEFNGAIVRHALPASLRILSLSLYYSTPFTTDSFALCPQLEELRIPSPDFTQPLTAELLPLSLRILSLDRLYPVHELQLPSTVAIRRS